MTHRVGQILYCYHDGSVSAHRVLKVNPATLKVNNLREEQVKIKCLNRIPTYVGDRWFDNLKDLEEYAMQDADNLQTRLWEVEAVLRKVKEIRTNTGEIG